MAHQSRPRSSAREFLSEQDVGQLGLTIGRKSVKATGEISVVKSDFSIPMTDGGDVDHPTGRTRQEAIEKQRGQQKRREVVDRPRGLATIGRLRLLVHTYARGAISLC